MALVWLINGLYCKVLNFVPRHQQIVGEILGSSYAEMFTKCIGFSEILMAIWILSDFKPKINAILQIAIVLIMNVLEFSLVPNLLLWGKLNVCFAILFAILIYINEFVIKPKLSN